MDNQRLTYEQPTPAAATVDIDDPTWDQVETAISNLDGRHATMVVLAKPDWSLISIGGGGPGRDFNVALTMVDDQFFSLANPSSECGDPVGLVVGGQLGYYPCRTVVDKAYALQAAREFFDSGCIESELTWVPS